MPDAFPQQTILEIESLDQRGEGIARIDGEIVKVPFSLPGETIAAEITTGRAIPRTILVPSPDRIAPFCPHFGRCGGCQLQHLGEDTYRAFKTGLLATALARQGIAGEIGDLVDARGRGRRRATLHGRKSGVGFNIARSHEVNDLDICPILVPELAAAPQITRKIRKIVGDCDVIFTATLSGLDVAIRAKFKGRDEPLIALMPNSRIARLSLNGEVIATNAYPEIMLGRARLRLPPQAFLQATVRAEEVLASLIGNALPVGGRVADLFSGVGTFAARLAENAQILMVDSDRAALAAGEKAIRAAPGLRLLGAAPRNLFTEPLEEAELDKFDAIVFDPPRAGAAAQARKMANSKVPMIVAISCDPQSFALDAATLIKGGYTMSNPIPVDQFAFSAHIEIFATFTRLPQALSKPH